MNKADLATYRNKLESFLKDYADYLDSFVGYYSTGNEKLRTSLQRRTPLITRIVSAVNDRGSYTIQKIPLVFTRYLPLPYRKTPKIRIFGIAPRHMS